MLAKYLLAGVAGSAMLASVAFAQSPTATSTATKMKRRRGVRHVCTSSSFQGNWRASKVVGLSVYNDNNESVGSINDMLTDKSGSIKAVVIGVGGFLGVGEHLVAVPFDKVKFVNEPVAYTVHGQLDGNTRPPEQVRRPRRLARRTTMHRACSPIEHAVSGSRRVQRDQG